jgi:ABC-2 type transport system permease protein
MSKIARDTWLLFQRSVMLTLRNPLWLAIGLLQPVLYLALFAPLLKRIVTIPGFPPGGAFNVFVPGLLIQLGLFGAAFVGFGLLAEMRAGVIERLRVTPASRIAMLLGRALRDVLMLLSQGIILIALAVPFGLTLHVGGVVVGLVMLALVGLLVAPLSYAVALWLGSEDALASFLNTVSLPLLLLSGILLPMSLAPGWLQTLAAINPLSHVVSGMRALFIGDFTNAQIYWGAGLLVVLAAISLIVAARAFGRSQA